MPVVHGLPIRALSARAALVVALSSALGGTGASAPQTRTPSSRALLDSVWRGVQQAQKRHVSGCGTLAETRVSPLLRRPLAMSASFCAAGLDRFRIAYAGPDGARVVYNRGVLNVSADGGRRTKVIDVGGAVRRAQGYFAGPHASENLERDFSITVVDAGDLFALELVPVSGRIARRVKRVAVDLGKADFLPRRLQIEGRSGVSSTYEIRIEKLDTALDEALFKVYRP